MIFILAHNIAKMLGYTYRDVAVIDCLLGISSIGLSVLVSELGPRVRRLVHGKRIG